MKKDINEAMASLQVQLERFVMSKVHNPDVAKDIVQEVFLKAREKSYTLKDEQKLHAWLFRITSNTITDFFRKKETWVSLNNAEQKSDEASEQFDKTGELTECVVPMINHLPEKYREPLILSDLEGWSQKEIAEKTGLSHSGAKSRVQRGRKKLKQMFIECCHVKTDKYGNVIDYTANSVNSG